MTKRIEEGKMDKKENPLVSIITPCYNGELFVHRLLDSIVSQTYDNMEFIFVNDGSTDRTEDIVLSYTDKFKLKGIQFKYIYQDNRGVSGALNKGLGIFRGEYLTWPDSDDILHVDNISARVDFLENNREYSAVLTDSMWIDRLGNDLGTARRIPPLHDDNLFSDLINYKNVYLAGGAFMLRSSAFFKSNPGRSIYESRIEQSLQMLLPVFYNNKCGYISKILHYIYVRDGSISRQTKDLQGFINRWNEYEDLLLNVINSIADMPDSEKEYWYVEINKLCARDRFMFAIQYRDITKIEEFYEVLKKNNYDTFRDRVLYLSEKYTLVHYVYRFLRVPWRLLKRLKGSLTPSQLSNYQRISGEMAGPREPDE